MSARAYVFAGGGSGGHIFPGLAVAERLEELDPGARPVHVCSTRNIDDRILRAAGVEWRPVRAHPASIRPLALARFVLGWGAAVRACREVIREFEASALIALGGFVAAPAAQAAKSEKLPLVLVNLDGVPGKANRWIARRADRVLTAARVAGQRGSGWERMGPIVRREAMPPPGMDAGACRERFGLAPDAPALLVMGGSQGARSLNALMEALAMDRPGLLAGWQIIHQAGSDGCARAQEAYDRAGVRARVVEFIEEPGVAWGAAECALSRAGAGAVGEAWANAVPTVFAPYPFHRDRHQRANAAEMAEAGAAAITTDYVSPDRNLRETDGTGAVLAEILRDAPRRREMRDAARGLGPADGARYVAQVVIDISERGDSTSPSFSPSLQTRQ